MCGLDKFCCQLGMKDRRKTIAVGIARFGLQSRNAFVQNIGSAMVSKYECIPMLDANRRKCVSALRSVVCGR
eukprot:4314897-Amphidinium_carterae.1